MPRLHLAFSMLIPILACGTVAAHVQIVLPQESLENDSPVKKIGLSFVEHVSKESPVYSMGKPKALGVLVNGKKEDLTATLQTTDRQGNVAFTADYTMKEPGAHVFFLEPAAYWYAEESALITHYTKVILNSCDAGFTTESDLGWENYEGWDALVGLPVEIEPLVQCTALWTNSIFRGIVRVDGKPEPFARIEIEYQNNHNDVELPSNAFVTQIVKADANGVFAFAPVRAGWWVLSAIVLPETSPNGPNGEPAESELAGVLWIRCVDID